MRKNKTQTFTIIRKNGKQYMTQMSRKGALELLTSLVTEWIAFLRTAGSRMHALWNGNGGKSYVALSSGRLHGGMQMGRR